MDAVCLGFGFLPSSELTNACGCATEYVPAWGCYAPKVDAWLESSVPNLFVVGDAAGIRGVEIAKEQGRLAALAVARRQGKLSDRQLEERSRPIRKRLARLQRFRQMVDALYAFDPELCANLVTTDTIVCRCEEVTADAILQAIAQGATDVYGVKMRSQAGMGPCQGRNCSPVVTQIACSGAGKDAVGDRAISVAPFGQAGADGRLGGTRGLRVRDGDRIARSPPMTILETIRKDIPIPLYYQLKEWILGQIESGELVEGDQVPSEQALSGAGLS